MSDPQVDEQIMIDEKVIQLNDNKEKPKRINPWVEHVKEYSKKKKMSYCDAMKCEKCKTQYKKKNKGKK